MGDGPKSFFKYNIAFLCKNTSSRTDRILIGSSADHWGFLCDGCTYYPEN